MPARQAHGRRVGSFEREGCDISKMVEEKFVEAKHKSRPSPAGVGLPESAIVTSPYGDTEMLQSTKETMESWVRERGAFFIVEVANGLRLMTL